MKKSRRASLDDAQNAAQAMAAQLRAEGRHEEVNITIHPRRGQSY